MKKKKILLIVISGIGNTVLQSPLIDSILKRDEFEVDILFRIPAIKTVFGRDKRINKSYILGYSIPKVKKDKLLNLPKVKKEPLKLIYKLRKNKYDYSILTFPSNRAEFNLLSFIIGAKKRIIHSYNTSKLRNLNFLSNATIKADDKLNDLEQNLNLLKALNINPEKVKREISFYLNNEDKKFANAWFKKNKITKKDVLVGIHSGCSIHNIYRRWPKEHFVKLIDILTKQKKKIFLFVGPDEVEEANWIYNQSKNKDKIFLVQEELQNVAALINKCKVLVCTDSGLGHIAAALKVHAFALFGPAMASRTSPYGKYGHYISLNLPCSPCMKYPFYSISDKIKCKNYKCLIMITPEFVYNTVKSFLP